MEHECNYWNCPLPGTVELIDTEDGSHEWYCEEHARWTVEKGYHEFSPLV